MPTRREPGYNFDQFLILQSAQFGERFAGQTPDPATGPNEAILGTPAPPLRIRPGKPGQNLAVAFHRGFGSNALFPLGPDGFAFTTGRGEGSVAILFPAPQRAVGFLVHTDYEDPLGVRDIPQGHLRVRFFDATGSVIADLDEALHVSINDFGYRFSGPGAGFLGVLIENDDPGGIALDDILFSRLAGLS